MSNTPLPPIPTVEPITEMPVALDPSAWPPGTSFAHPSDSEPDGQFQPKNDAALDHGHARRGATTPEYLTWLAMKRRCTNPNYKSYHYYGGRGIRVCDEWMKSFKAFLADMGRKPSAESTIDRINNDGHYEPGNCRWISIQEQQANKRAYGTASARQKYDITFTMLPSGEWSAIDRETYDDDPEARLHCIGVGKTKEDALSELIDKIAEAVLR